MKRTELRFNHRQTIGTITRAQTKQTHAHMDPHTHTHGQPVLATLYAAWLTAEPKLIEVIFLLTAFSIGEWQSD